MSRPESRPIWSLTDRKSIRLNSSHRQISYAVFCLKKKKMRRRIAGVLGARRYRGADRSRVATRADRLNQRSPAPCSTRFECYEVSGVAARCRTARGYAEDARRRRRRLLLRLRQGRRRVLDRPFRELRGRQRACPEPKDSYRAGLEELHGYRNRDPSTEHLARLAGDAAGRRLSALPPRPGRAEPAEDLP